MADDGRLVLNHYNISNPFPTEWPAENDDSDTSEPELPLKSVPQLAHSKSRSRYTVLERNGGDRRSLVPGSEKTRDGLENLVQRDEPDPLGATDSVVRALRQKGLPVDDDQLLRNRFLLSSTTFTPTLYLSQVHSDTSAQSLLQGLEYLSQSIDQKSASLKVLVESNFERFVRAKSTIDNVYTEMRNQGSEPQIEKPRTHSRHASRNSTHFRNISGQGLPTPGIAFQKAPSHDKKKHALTKESEYGVQGIKVPLIEVAVKAEEVWGPALGGRDREESLRMILGSIERSQGVLEVGAAISDYIKRKDYDKLIKEYSRARRYADDARNIANVAIHNSLPLTESQVHQIVMTGRMWLQVEDQIDAFKRDVWRNLTSFQANLAMSTDRSHQEDHMTLIGLLLELGVEDNPIWVWLLSRYDYLKNKINSTFARSRVEIEVFRRRVANADKPSLYASAMHLKSATLQGSEDTTKQLDTNPVLELWDLIYQSLSNLLSVQGGLLGEVIDFWSRAQSFINGNAQRVLPTGIDGSSRKHHRLSSDGTRDLQKGALELVDLLRENMFSFFADPPIEDISALYSPLPTDTPNTPRSATVSPFSQPEHRFRLDLLSPPPPSPKRGEYWEEFAFWPPYANSLSGVYHLGKIMGLLGIATIEMASLSPVAPGSSEHEKLKHLLGGARERSVRAICAAWSGDAEKCKMLEDWTRKSDQSELTRMPAHFAAIEAFVLSGIQKIVYISDIANTKRNTTGIITPPPNKLVQMIRSQFVTSLYKALSGMVENAEKPVNFDRDPWTTDQGLTIDQQSQRGSVDPSRDTIDASNRNLRMLLTLSNLKALQTEIVPQLVSQFETNFSVRLSEECKPIYDVLGQINKRLFQSYIRPTEEKLSTIIRNGISSPKWLPTTERPTEVRPYVYEGLLLLVYIHTEVSTTAAPLTPQILSYLLEHIVSSLLEAFRMRSKYNLASMMQATLDVEFFAQTLSQYNTDQASEITSQVYLELDRGNDKDIKNRLEVELPEMSATLKRLREAARNEFACFKKQRSPKDRPNKS